MKLEEARTLRQALDTAIAEAEATGSETVALADTLSAELGDALADLSAAIDAAKK